jgi:hypothetical protein
MRRLYLAMVLAISIQACSGLPLNGLNAPTDVPGPTATATVTLTPMDTPTATITPTITPSPTIVHIPTWDPSQPTATFIPVPIFIGEFTATPVAPIASMTPALPGPGFLSVQVSEKKIFWGSCKPNMSRIITQVESPDDVYTVTIFVKVRSATKPDETPWTQGDSMDNHGNGRFTYRLYANTTRGHNHYKNSWILFQLVATDDFGEEVGRTMIYETEIALSPCMGTLGH